MTAWLERVVRAAGRRPGRVLAVAVLVAALGALAGLRLEPTAATDTLVGRSTDAFKATERFHERFGDDAVVILVSGDLTDIVLTDNLGKLLGLEGCIAGNKPADVPAPGGPDGPCAALARTKPVRVVYGPGTFINVAVGEIQRQFAAQVQATRQRARAAARAARAVARRRGVSEADAGRYAQAAAQAVTAEFQNRLLQLAVRYGLNARSADVRIDNPDFVYNLVFDPARGATAPKARFAFLFPNERSAVISVRLEPGLSEAERSEAIGLIRRAVAMPRWTPRNGVTYSVTGAPVLVSDVTDVLADSLLRLLVGGLVLMALVLALVFRSRARLLPLAVALGAVATVFGLMSLLGLRLTMASIAVLPVLLGLGVDYAIQYQARVEEEGAEHAARHALPTIAAAGLATVTGFLVLLLSPVPMVRGFGLLLVVGILFAFCFAVTAGTAALAAQARRVPARGVVADSVRGAAELLRAAGTPVRAVAARLRLRRRATAAAAGVTGFAMRRPVAVLAAGAVLAVMGWAVDSRTPVESDVRKLVPRDLPGVRDLGRLIERTGVAGEVDVLVEGNDLTEPAAIAWMRDYQARLAKRFRFGSAKGCGEAELCPALSLPDLFRTSGAAADRERVRALLDAVPPYFSQAVVTADRRAAALTFGVRSASLERQKRVIDVMREELDPPPGIRASVTGLPVLASEANAALAAPLRRLGTAAAGLLLVALVLFAVYRRWERAWVPLVPIALATGWSALVLFLLGVPLNPMSATLGALVIAISTEFAVLLTARFREERAAGLDRHAALRRTYASTGATVLASGVTAIAGFAVLAFSDVTMLRDFGRVTVVDLTVSLLGVLAVLPAVLTLAERWREHRLDGGGPAQPADAPAVGEPVPA